MSRLSTRTAAVCRQYLVVQKDTVKSKRPTMEEEWSHTNNEGGSGKEEEKEEEKEVGGPR